MASAFFELEEVPVEMQEDGTVKVTVKIEKDGTGAMSSFKDVIKYLKQKQADDTYKDIELKYLNDEAVRYVIAEITLDSPEEAAVLNFFINPMNMEAELRVLLTEETINGLPKQEAPEEQDPWAEIVANAEYTGSINVYKADSDEDSMASAFFELEEVPVEVQEDGKVKVTLKINKDGMGFTDVIEYLKQQQEDENYTDVELKYLDDASIRYVVADITLNSLEEAAVLKFYIVPMQSAPALRVLLTEETISELKPEAVPVAISIEKTDAKATTGSITITATGGSGTFEYTIDGGKTWENNSEFVGLAAGTYSVGARDIANVKNSSSLQEVVILGQTIVNNDGLKDGNYSVDISVLQETQDTASMAAVFFKKDELPLRIENGKAYLTIQVLKDGMGMKDVIASLEQRIDGSYTDLYLEHLNDASIRYITTEVEFESIDDEAYIRCDIVPMQGMKPVLRIKLNQDSIEEGLGTINTNFKANVELGISTVEAENGKVKVTLNDVDENLTINDFKGKVYLDNSTSGKELTLKNFKMEEEVITFEYDEIKATQKDQKVVIGITFKEVETKAEAFTVKGLVEEVQVKEILTLKENAKEIKYIKGYEDGTFRPNGTVTKAEALSLLSRLVDGMNRSYYLANISVLQAEKDEPSMSAQFFKTEDVVIKKQGENYLVELEIVNEGLGFTNIITSIEHKVNGKYETVEVHKSEDMKKAYVTLEVAQLDEAIVLRTGIAPMGNVTPELRIIVDTKSLEESTFVTRYTDIDMWAKDAIIVFEEAGVIGENGEEKFNPNQGITRAEFVKVIAQIAGLEVSEDYKHGFKDIEGHVYENYIAAANEAGYISGYGNNTFKPEGTLTRAEAVKVINKLIGHTEETNVEMENTFKDLSEKHWAYNEILKVAEV